MTEGIKERADVAGDGNKLDPIIIERAMGIFKSEQDLLGGFFAGCVASMIGAAIWAVITIITKFQIGWMAVGVGFLVGIAIRSIGKGMDKFFGYMGALLALLGCLLGNLFTVCYFVSVQEQISLINLFLKLTPSIIVSLMIAAFHPMDLLFYGIAVYEGYQLSFRKISEEEFMNASKRKISSIEPA